MATASQRASQERSDLRYHRAGVVAGAGMALAPAVVPLLRRRWYIIAPVLTWLPVLPLYVVGRLFATLLGAPQIQTLALMSLVVAFFTTVLCVFVKVNQSASSQSVPPVSPARSIEPDQFAAFRRDWPSVAESAGLLGLPVEPETTALDVARVVATNWNGAPSPRPATAPSAPPILDIVATPLGPALTVQMHPGQKLGDFEKGSEIIANRWQVRKVRVAQPEETNFVVITLVTENPLAQTFEITSDTIPAMTSLRAVEVGRQEDGEPWLFPLAECHAVVGGVPGAGKSVFANVVLAGVAQRSDVQIVGIDCAGGVELSDWSPRLSALATNQDEALEALQALWREHERRIEWLKANRYKSMANAGFSDEMPLYICLIDEAAQLFRLESMNKAEKEKGLTLVDLVTRLITVSRKTGIVMVLATQKPQATTIPTLARDNAQVRVCFRVMTPEAARTVLGDTLSLARVPPTAIRREQKGVALAESADGDLTLVRSYYISEDSDRAIAAQYAHLTRKLTVED